MKLAILSQSAKRALEQIGRLWIWIHRSREVGEQAIMTNRLLLAAMVLVAAGLHARFGVQTARDFFVEGRPWLAGYFVVAGAIQVHLLLHPGSSAARQMGAITMDSAIISYGLSQGDASSAYLFPLYFWMILGNGVRLGMKFMGFAVGCAAIGFAATFWVTPFWRANVALSVGLFIAIVIIPLYGALLLRRLAEARAEAERANHAKTLLLASVSHELRTPLTAILGLGDLLQKSPLNAEQREMARTISGAGGILLRQIESLLKVSRDEMEPHARLPETVDLFALLADLRAMLAVEADKKGVRLGLFIDAGTPRHILAEPGLLLDIFQNLGGNAVKFTPKGAVAIRVGTRRCGPASIELRAEVSDTGIGIDRAARKRIFESFVQASPDIAARFGGSGLGLAIARRRLEAHGGRIGVASLPGGGSQFWFELTVGTAHSAAPQASPHVLVRLVAPEEQGHDGPQMTEPVCVVAPQGGFDAPGLARRYALAAIASSQDEASVALAQELAGELSRLGEPSPEAGEACAAAPKQPLKILLAEDNGVNRMVLDKILSGGGHATTLVCDGEAALDAMLNETFDVILLDVNMPGISGVEAAQLYAFALPGRPRAPLLGLTADASAQRREQCLAAGMVACLTKPIAPDALLAAVAGAHEAREIHEIDPAPARGRRETEGCEPDALEPQALATLAALGGDGFVRDLILQFVGEGAGIADRLTRSVETGDLQAFLHEAHALESCAGNLGARGIAALCRSWRDMTPERLALHGDDELDALRIEWARAAQGFSARLSPRREPGRGDAAA